MTGDRARRAMAVALASVLLLLSARTPCASAADIKVMSSVALMATLDDLKPKFESARGNKITLVYSVIADLKKRVEAGETADVMILSRGAVDELETQGNVAPGSITNVASSYAAIAVRAGAPRPNILTADNLKAALLGAKSIVYADPAKGERAASTSPRSWIGSASPTK